MKSFDELVEKGKPLVQQAVDSLRRYHDAQKANHSGEEVERLRAEAESLFNAVTDHQLRALGRRGATRH